MAFHKSLVSLRPSQPGVTHKSFVTQPGLPVVTRRSLEIPLMVRPAGTRRSLATRLGRLGVIHRNLCYCWPRRHKTAVGHQSTVCTSTPVDTQDRCILHVLLYCIVALELCCIVASGLNCTPAVLVGVEWSCRTAGVPSDTAVLEQSNIAAGVSSDTADGGQWYTVVVELPLQPADIAALGCCYKLAPPLVLAHSDTALSVHLGIVDVERFDIVVWALIDNPETAPAPEPADSFASVLAGSFV